MSLICSNNESLLLYVDDTCAVVISDMVVTDPPDTHTTAASTLNNMIYSCMYVNSVTTKLYMTLKANNLHNIQILSFLRVI